MAKINLDELDEHAVRVMLAMVSEPHDTTMLPRIVRRCQKA